MPRLPILSGLAIVKVLNKIGYKIIRQKGSHIWLDCPDRKRITVPNYKAVDRNLLLKIIKNADITQEEFIALL